MKKYMITEWCHRFIEENIKEGDLWLDATAGNGNDTLFLAERVGEEGKVIAFDIQDLAIKRTENLLKEHNLLQRAELVKESHLYMNRYAGEGEAAGIVFNFGYLPGGDHSKSTKGEVSVQAVECGLKLLRKGGVMSLCIYSGGDSGYEEKEILLNFLKGLDSGKYLVILSSYYNRPNDPPVPVFVIRL